MASTLPKSKVYRLRGCPSSMDISGVAKLLSKAFGDVSHTDITVQSLATDLNHPSTKVGTLMFEKLPALIEGQKEKDTWVLKDLGFNPFLTLDTHFRGITPLNDVEEESYEFDCIAISGLASHPFGSWQPKGIDKSFMWIRDRLPWVMPQVRISIYGYDTTLHESKSFQTIPDLAMSFIHSITIPGKTHPGAKPWIFLAHSLGGIVLKEAFAILADNGQRNTDILDLFKGGIFFGVPSQGMSTKHLLAMVEGQENYKMIEDLSEDSVYLQKLDEKFSGLCRKRSMDLYWGYETKKSPTVVKTEDGSFARAGQEEILVSKKSATRNLYSSQPPNILPINETHSDMVKFGAADPNLDIVIKHLRNLRNDVIRTISEMQSSTSGTKETGPMSHGQTKNWTMQSLKESLEIPGQHHRFDTIDENFEHTFEWVFDAKKSLFSTWLRDGDGLFWIHGKPGSGKSTLMKFIAQNPRTWEHFHKFSSNDLAISARFFFHDRGGSLQKSFVGLLYSLNYQIIDQIRNSGMNVTEFETHMNQHISPQEPGKSWTLGALRTLLRYLILQQIHLDLSLFLLLDALDEYDGKPEFICQFLGDLMEVSAKGHTKLKILFSSRLWKEFEDQFQRVPSIQLQDYTRNDIEKYCRGTIPLVFDRKDPTKSERLVRNIVDKANGVFLWVKLALDELINHARQETDFEKLQDTLDSIPSDLQKYYERTVQRIPRNLLCDAYIMFEVLSKSSDVFSPFEIMTIVECSKSFSYEEYCRVLETQEILEWKRLIRSKVSLRKAKPSDVVFSEISSKISTITGNLVEMVYSQDEDISMRSRIGKQAKKAMSKSVYMGGMVILAPWLLVVKTLDTMLPPAGPNPLPLSLIRSMLPKKVPNPRVQFIHQTVKEFICSQDFKKTIQKFIEAKLAEENGHTFLTKYILVRGKHYHYDHHHHYHLSNHEATTGRSLKVFIDSLPEKYYSDTYEIGYGVSSRLTFAVHHNLQLYLQETLNSDPDVFRNTKEKLLSVTPILRTIPTKMQQHLDLLRFLLKNGYTIGQDPGVLAEIQNYSPSQGIELEIVKTILAQCGPDISIQIPSKFPFSLSHPRQREYLHCMTALHQARTPEFARYILDQKVEVNEQDSLGMTPLDHVIKDVWRRDLPLWDAANLRDTAKLLIEHGGITAKTTRREWDVFVKKLKHDLPDLDFPGGFPTRSGFIDPAIAGRAG